VLLGLSGGADSVFLLRCLAESRPRPAAFALHLDHGLRGAESAADADFCRELARRWRVPLRCERLELEPGASDLERRAREARYRALARQARELELELVLTAHHADDALETLLMRWLRGTTLAGLSGLVACAPLPLPRCAGGGLRVVRPLLGLRAAAIRAQLVAAGQAWREDSSNASPRFTRNRVRHELLPLVERVAGPRALDDLFAFHGAAAALRERLAAERPPDPLEGGAQPAAIPRAPLAALSDPVLRQHLWHAIVSRTGRAPGAKALERIVVCLRSARRGAWSLRGAWTLRLGETQLELLPPPAAPRPRARSAGKGRPPVTSFPGPGRLSAPTAPDRPLRTAARSPHPFVPPTLKSNLSETLATISAAAARHGRAAQDVSLVAVTKSVGAATAAELVRLGQLDLGENRLLSLLHKRAELERLGLAARWHFIGHIQGNKARRVVKNSEVLHSVDSLGLIETLERLAEQEQRVLRVYLEVKLAEDEHKHGLAPAELPAAVALAGAAHRLELLGLMTMAPQPAAGQDAEVRARPVFEKLARLARELEGDALLRRCFVGRRVRLSMGMSGDFEAAIAAGSDVVRIGSALFRGLATDAPTAGGRR
jgi:pyridoxal phosphate enzyme (YggS family)